MAFYTIKAGLTKLSRPVVNVAFRAFSNTSEAVVTCENGVKTITFNRPTKRNAWTAEMYGTIISTMNESNTDENTKLLVLTGSGDHYTSGTDQDGPTFLRKSMVTGLQTLGTVARFKNMQNQKEVAKESHEILLQLVGTFIDFKKPIIALVNGHCIGIGTTTLGLTDIVFASDKATFSTPSSTIVATSSYIFPRIMGCAKANEMLMFNQRLNAQEAHKCRLVTRVFPHDKFGEETSKIINEMAKLPLKSLMYSKELVRGRERELLHKVKLAECSQMLERLQSEEFAKVSK